MTTKLEIINDSKDSAPAFVVIQQNHAGVSPGETAIAWQVFEGLAPSESRSFTLLSTFEVAVVGPRGELTSRLPASNGHAFRFVQDATGGDQLAADGVATVDDEVQVANLLSVGSIAVNLYNDGNLIAATPVLLPAQVAAFGLQARIAIAALSDAAQGQVLNAAIVSGFTASFDLAGVEAAQIVINGGGGSPYLFGIRATS